MRSPRLLVGAACVALACGGAPGDPSAATGGPPPPSEEDVRAEHETLGHEIDDLAAYLDAHPDWSPQDPADPDPRAVLEAARRTHEAAGRALAAADTLSAADSLRAAAARIEHVKRLLGVAEEMGLEFEPGAPAD